MKPLACFERRKVNSFLRSSELFTLWMGLRLTLIYIALGYVVAIASVRAFGVTSIHNSMCNASR